MFGQGLPIGFAFLPSIPVDFLVIAGGGSGFGSASTGGGGGGAGGLRTSYGLTSGGGSNNESQLAFNPGTVYTITVGGAATDSSIAGGEISLTSLAGGGGSGSNGGTGSSGGSGGGSIKTTSVAAGTANQGYAGGGGDGSNYTYGGGGGAAGTGLNYNTNGRNGDGGPGLSVNILNATNATTAAIGEVSGSDVYYAGGGGGGMYCSFTGNRDAGHGGIGGGGRGYYYNDCGAGIINGPASQSGKVNSGSGGGGHHGGGSPYGGTAGGSGIVILRIPTSDYSGTTTGSPDVYVEGSDTVVVFKGSGTYTQ